MVRAKRPPNRPPTDLIRRKFISGHDPILAHHKDRAESKAEELQVKALAYAEIKRDGTTGHFPVDIVDVARGPFKHLGGLTAAAHKRQGS